MLRTVVTARQRSCGKVIFSDKSVRQSVCLSIGALCPCDHYAWFTGPHCTVSTSPLLDMGPHWTGTWDLVAITGNQFKLVHFRHPPPTGSDMWWLSKHVRSAEAGGTHPTGKISCYCIVKSQWAVSLLSYVKFQESKFEDYCDCPPRER